MENKRPTAMALRAVDTEQLMSYTQIAGITTAILCLVESFLKK